MFDGARSFGIFAALVLAAGLIASQSVGLGVLVAVVVGLYFLLHFFNQLETRDLKDAQKGPKHDVESKKRLPRRRR